MTTTIKALLAAVTISAVPGGTSNISSLLIIQDAPGSAPTCASATAAGELCVEGDIEANGNLDIAGTVTLTGAVTLGGDLNLENAEIIENGTDDLICFQGSGGVSDEDICLDLDGTNTVGLSSTTGALELDFQTLNAAFNDDADIVLGTGNDAIITFDNAVAAPDSLIIGVGQESRQINIIEAADIAVDLTFAQQTNPTLAVHSADSGTVTDYITLAHDQTDGVITTGGGSLSLAPAGAITAITGALTVSTTSDLNGDISAGGGAGALTFDTAAASIVVPNASATALILGSSGNTAMITIDTQAGFEKTIFVGTTAQDALHVDTGTTQLDENVDCGDGVDITGALTVSTTSDLNGDISAGGGAGALTFDTASASVVVPNASAAGLILGSSGNTAMLTFDTQAGVEKLIVVGTTTQVGLHVDVGTLLVDEAATITGILTQTGAANFAALITANGGVDRLPFTVAFDEGATKGLSLLKFDGTAYSTTADHVNYLTYGHPSARFVMETPTTAAGTVTPVAAATGLDIQGAGVGIADEWVTSTGQLGAIGAQIIVGTTPAWIACATWISTVVAQQAAMFLEVTTPGVPVVFAAADPDYTSYAAIGQVAGDIYVSDQTTGGTDTNDNWANTESHALCILGDGSGVITYTLDGGAPSSTDTHTLADGVPHIVRIQGLTVTGTTSQPILTAFSVNYQ